MFIRAEFRRTSQRILPTRLAAANLHRERIACFHMGSRQPLAVELKPRVESAPLNDDDRQTLRLVVNRPNQTLRETLVLVLLIDNEPIGSDLGIPALSATSESHSIVC